MTTHFDLAGLIGSRICHDIISPLGAVGNGVELMALTGQVHGPEFDLVRESIESANERIKFFRVAFGAAAPGQMVSRNDLLSLLRTVASSGRLNIDWQIDTGLPRLEVKRIMLAFQCLDYLMPVGGTIDVTRGSSGEWLLRARATKFRDAPSALAALSDDRCDAELAAAEVQFALLRMETQAQGLTSSANIANDTMLIIG